jgi:iron complex outermembrane receptor protein
LDWYYTGPIVYSVTRKDTNQPGFSTFNARIAYTHTASDITAALAVTNLFDKFYWRNFFVYQDIGFPHVNGQPAPPRQWSLSLTKRF